MNPEHAKQIMAVALDKVAIERTRQVEEKGYTAEHDDSHGHDEIALAAANYLLPWDFAAQDVCYLDQPSLLAVGTVQALIEESSFEIGRKQQRLIEDSQADLDARIDDVVTGCALGLAELERLLRMSELQERDD